MTVNQMVSGSSPEGRVKNYSSSIKIWHHNCRSIIKYQEIRISNKKARCFQKTTEINVGKGMEGVVPP
jgi:hypothetical protein